MNMTQKVKARFSVAKKADELGLLDFNRVTLKMDLENFDTFFNGQYTIDYVGLLEADNEKFELDIMNLQMIIDREKMTVKNNDFSLSDLIRYKLKDDSVTLEKIKGLQNRTDFYLTIDTDNRLWKNDMENMQRVFLGYADELGI